MKRLGKVHHWKKVPPPHPNCKIFSELALNCFYSVSWYYNGFIYWKRVFKPVRDSCGLWNRFFMDPLWCDRKVFEDFQAWTIMQCEWAGQPARRLGSKQYRYITVLLPNINPFATWGGGGGFPLVYILHKKKTLTPPPFLEIIFFTFYWNEIVMLSHVQKHQNNTFIKICTVDPVNTSTFLLQNCLWLCLKNSEYYYDMPTVLYTSYLQYVSTVTSIIWSCVGLWSCLTPFPV